MIGTDLNLTIPTLSDTYSVALSAIGVALEAIETSIADKATQAGINITSSLTLNGNLLTSVGGVLLVAGNTPVAEGSVYYAGGYLAMAFDYANGVMVMFGGQVGGGNINQTWISGPT